MSVTVRQVVELTLIKPMAKKALLLHIADTVRDGEHAFFRSNSEVARRLGTDRQFVRRHIRCLTKDGILTEAGEVESNGGIVQRYELEISALLALECIHGSDKRTSLLAKAQKRGGTGRGRGEVSRASGVGAENTTNLSTTEFTEHFAEKEIDCPQKKKDTREVDSADHLKHDARFAAFLAEQQARRD